jgi:cystathionine beta-lyase/cystathionine gamma-synthase
LTEFSGVPAYNPLLRVFVGIEDVEDLLADFAAALSME